DANHQYGDANQTCQQIAHVFVEAGTIPVAFDYPFKDDAQEPENDENDECKDGGWDNTSCSIEEFVNLCRGINHDGSLQQRKTNDRQLYSTVTTLPNGCYSGVPCSG